MRTLIAVAVLAVASTACSDPTMPDTPKPLGTFSLFLVDGQSLPATGTTTGDVILARKLILHRDGTYTDRVRFIAEGSPTEQVTVETHGGWLGSPDRMRLIPDGESPVPMDATVHGVWLELDQADATWTFLHDAVNEQDLKVNRNPSQH